MAAVHHCITRLALYAANNRHHYFLFLFIRTAYCLYLKHVIIHVTFLIRFRLKHVIYIDHVFPSFSTQACSLNNYVFNLFLTLNHDVLSHLLQLKKALYTLTSQQCARLISHLVEFLKLRLQSRLLLNPNTCFFNCKKKQKTRFPCQFRQISAKNIVIDLLFSELWSINVLRSSSSADASQSHTELSKAKNVR